MPKNYESGELIKGNVGSYKINRLLNQGNYANSYEAAEAVRGFKVFLKQYIDPTPACGEEYTNFVQHQERVKEKLDTIDIVEKNYEYFEFDNCYFQAKEFMEGKNLSSFLNDVANPPTDEERFLIATVVMYAIRKIHENGLVHTDLKPEQIYLRENPAIRLRYEIKIVDFDFCRLPGLSEPLHIAGTPFYKSPEHIRGETPDFKSDVFTCGIILYQILGGTEPHEGSDEPDYNENVLKYRVAKRLKELNPLVSDELSELVFKMLDPAADHRPEARDVHEILLRELARIRSVKAATISPGEATTSPVTAAVPRTPVRVEFYHPAVRYPVSAHKTMILGRDNFRAYGEGFRYLSPQQFQIIKTDAGWKIKGLAATNPTFYNGADCTDIEMDIADNASVKVGNFELKTKLVYE